MDPVGKPLTGNSMEGVVSKIVPFDLKFSVSHSHVTQDGKYVHANFRCVHYCYMTRHLNDQYFFLLSEKSHTF